MILHSIQTIIFTCLFDLLKVGLMPLTVTRILSKITKYNYLMSVCSIVKTITPSCCGLFDALLQKAVIIF